MNEHAYPYIVLGVTGGIAAYKTPELVRRLREQGAQVEVVLTRAARRFVAPMALQAVSGQLVRSSLWDENAEAAMGHIELARRADKILIAPASADFIARLALGAASDLLTTLCLATRSPIYIAPSMNTAMWENAATQDNIQLLMQRGITVIPPEIGAQACGEYGAGRLPEIERLVQHLWATNTLSGKRVLITAGPTREAIDPVRFISNHSSGKMGYALAQAALALGAKVTLVSGPTQLPPPVGANTLQVDTAIAMHQAVMENIAEQDIFIGTSAVSDYRPKQISPQKITKAAEHMMLDLVRNPDILLSVTALSHPPFTVGFAAQTHEVITLGAQKLKDKKMDMICINDVSKTDQGFHSDYNEVTLLSKTGSLHLPRLPKTILAQKIMQHIVESMHEKNSIKNS